MKHTEILNTLVVSNPELQEVIDYIDKLERGLETYARLKVAMLSTKPEKTNFWFPCGESGSKNEQGLPQYIDICPAFGADTWTRYSRTSLEGGLEW